MMCHLKLAGVAGVAGVAGSVSERKSSKSLPAGNVEIAEQQTTPTFLYERTTCELFLSSKVSANSPYHRKETVRGCRKDLLD